MRQFNAVSCIISKSPARSPSVLNSVIELTVTVFGWTWQRRFARARGEGRDLNAGRSHPDRRQETR